MLPFTTGVRRTRSGQAHLGPTTKNDEKTLTWLSYAADESGVSLQRFINLYKRDSDEIVGAVRLGSIESLILDHMPGGRFQITAHMISGDKGFISPVLPLTVGQQILGDLAALAAGDIDVNPVDRYLQRLEEARKQAELDELVAAQRANPLFNVDVWRPPS